MGLDQETREKLYAVIRAGMGVSNPSLELTDEEVSAFLKVAGKQSILPILYRGLKNMGVSEDSLAKYEYNRSKSEYRAIQHDNALRMIRDTLDAEGIPYVLLKGAVLRNLYPTIILRTSSDIDVLVRESDIERAVCLLEQKTDFKKAKESYHDISMFGSRVHLELHFSLKENDEKLDQLLTKAWEYAESSGEGSMFSFTPEYQIFYIIAHMSYHFLHGGLGIRPFLDLWLLRNKTQYDEPRVEELLSQCDLVQFYKECCYLSDVWMGEKDHTQTSELFEDFCLSGSVFGNEKFRIAGTQRNKRGWRYVCSRAFPPRYQVKEYYKDPSGKDHMLPYYYVKRWRSWLSKERRGDLSRQINATVKSDKEYQNMADDLFRRLGI
ncbi:MAG: nucleotidyltransferase family protein [Clostridiales bacterium]|nr:nucleotidyltransferase family protein [Clostridiales bacterium]